MNLNPDGEMIFDIALLPDPKQHIIHALYVGFDESENDDEKAAIERGLRAIVTFQERVGELPIKKEMSEIEKNLIISNSEENQTNKTDSSNINILSEEEFQKFSILRDQELETHFQHLKIQTAEEQDL
jgi:microcompartment protein CcmL/EutN